MLGSFSLVGRPGQFNFIHLHERRRPDGTGITGQNLYRVNYVVVNTNQAGDSYIKFVDTVFTNIYHIKRARLLFMENFDCPLSEFSGQGDWVNFILEPIAAARKEAGMDRPSIYDISVKRVLRERVNV